MLTLGFKVEPDEIITAVTAAHGVLMNAGVRRIAPFVVSETLHDLNGFDFAGLASDDEVDAVLLGDLGAAWTVDLLNRAFRLVESGAQLFALQKNRYWMGESGIEMDAGPFVAAIEYASNRDAVVCGKPSPEFFRAALGSMSDEFTGAKMGDVAMIGDDIWGDVEGAQQAGLQGWLVRTGKYRDGVIEESRISPDRVIDSISDLANVLS